MSGGMALLVFAKERYNSSSGQLISSSLGEVLHVQKATQSCTEATLTGSW